MELSGELKTRGQNLRHLQETYEEAREGGYEAGAINAIASMAELFGKIGGLEDWQIEAMEEEVSRIREEKGETSKEAELAREILIAVKNSGK